jgi:hypothetical protein
MRIFKLKTPLLALLLALFALAASVSAGFAIHSDLSVAGRILTWFYRPTEWAQSLCLPSSYFEKGFDGGRFLFPASFFLFGLLQWYLIFLVGIGIYRHFQRR